MLTLRELLLCIYPSFLEELNELRFLRKESELTRRMTVSFARTVLFFETILLIVVIAAGIIMIRTVTTVGNEKDLVDEASASTRLGTSMAVVDNWGSTYTRLLQRAHQWADRRIWSNAGLRTYAGLQGSAFYTDYLSANLAAASQSNGYYDASYTLSTLIVFRDGTSNPPYAFAGVGRVVDSATGVASVEYYTRTSANSQYAASAYAASRSSTTGVLASAGSTIGE